MKKQIGFTLLELMVTVVIIAILSSIALPSYQQYIQKTRRAEAKEVLSRLAAAQERYFFTNNNYTTTESSLGGMPASDFYTFTLGSTVTCGTAPTQYPCFTLTATAKSGQLKDTTCKTFTLDQTGKRNSTNSSNADSSGCW